MICPDLQDDLTIGTVPTTDTTVDANKDMIFNATDMLTENTELTTNPTLETEISTNTDTPTMNTDTPTINADTPASSEIPSAVANDRILYKCTACHENCTTIEAVRVHSRKVTCRDFIKSQNKDQTSGLYKCEVCDIKYPTLYLLRHHLKKHMARTFRCSSCPKSYLSKLELDIHQRTHTDERPHQCDKCPNSFRYAHHLKRHKDIIHFGKRYMCPEANCNRQFTTMDQLKVHKWSHCGIVPNKCKYCGQLFKKRLL